MFEFGCASHEITEEQWVPYFLQAKVSTFRNYKVVDEAMKSPLIDTSLREAQFREIVRHQLTMESHKTKEKQIVPFCTWTTTMLEQYMQWNDLEREQQLTLTNKSDNKFGNMTRKNTKNQNHVAAPVASSTSSESSSRNRSGPRYLVSPSTAYDITQTLNQEKLLY
ncbi:hypothetical protein PHMEG_00017483 [Phytophthora megakarya]|uniref:Uncharacterized protein n=1 Tax=Phytophthora megakarya TaxID=4795 RepID=A0A225VWQ6_9STRA|nr:hypothetical protein PHMEG_00017483 [Phytophthora megakarya]